MPKKTTQTEEEKKLVEVINEYIRIHKMGQEEMAQRLEVKQGTLSNWIRGNNGITPKCQSRIRFVCRGIIAEKETDGVKEAVKRKAINAIMASTMCADCKITAYRILETL